MLLSTHDQSGKAMGGIMFTRSSYGGTNSFAHQYVKPDTKEYYYITSDQITIPYNSLNESYETILSEKGLELLQNIKEKVEKGEFKDTFVKYRVDLENSGSWFGNASSPFYNPTDCKGCLNSWGNIVIRGYTQELLDNLHGNNPSYSDLTMKTSPVVFYTNQWCYTKSGSLYKLEEKITY